MSYLDGGQVDDQTSRVPLHPSLTPMTFPLVRRSLKYTVHQITVTNHSLESRVSRIFVRFEIPKGRNFFVVFLFNVVSTCVLCSMHPVTVIGDESGIDV